MSTRGKIARFWAAVGAAMLLVAAGFGVAAMWPRWFPGQYANELYLAYADRPGIDATFIKGYPLGDSLTVDVTLLQATDSAAWDLLRLDFGLAPIPSEVSHMVDTNNIIVHIAPRNDWCKATNTENPLKNDILAYSLHKKEVSIFHIQNTEQIRHVLYDQFNKSINQNNPKYETNH